MPIYRDIYDGPPRSYIGERTPKRWVVIHSTQNDASAEGEASYAKRRPDGISSHYYCLVPETRILHADLTWRPIGNVVVGDQVVGVDEEPNSHRGRRRLRRAVVTAASRRLALCLEVIFTDGRSVICTPDHPWLGRRVGPFQPSRTLAANHQRWHVVRGMQNPACPYCVSVIQPGTTRSTNLSWLATERLRPGDALVAPLVPWDAMEDWRPGYLAGILDGEGCYGAANAISFAQKEGAVLDRSKQLLAELGIRFTVTESRPNGVTVIQTSGLDSALRLVGLTRPVRFMGDRTWVDRAISSRLYRNDLAIEEIRPVGEREVVSVATSEGTFIAEGIISHNCDGNSIVQSLDTDLGAHHVGSSTGNRGGISYELTGFASWPRSRWLDSIAWPLLAAAVARDCTAHGITARELTVAQIRAGTTGIMTHNQARLAWGHTDHTDPGPDFPMDHLVDQVRAAMEDDMQLSDRVSLIHGGKRLWAGRLMDRDDMSVEEALMWGLGVGPHIELLPAIAQLRGQVDGLAALVRELAAAPPAPVTPEQLAALTTAVEQAATAGAADALERITVDREPA